MGKNLSIQELLYNRGLPEEARAKLVRHKDSRVNVYELYRSDEKAFLRYQSEQSKDVFKGVEYIVAFIGEAGTLARFVGVYKVVGSEKLQNFQYDLKEVKGFEDLKNRVIIDWGTATLSWHQWIQGNEKKVIEVMAPETFHNKRFPGYLDFVLDFTDLKEIIRNKGKFKDWYLMLSAVKGIYLILDKSTGNKYIGSAYGDDGIWRRWEEYIKTDGHGENTLLKELVKPDKAYAKNFQFTVLMTLPKSYTANEVIAQERLFKLKLGTRAFGLNLN